MQQIKINLIVYLINVKKNHQQYGVTHNPYNLQSIKQAKNPKALSSSVCVKSTVEPNINEMIFIKMDHNTSSFIDGMRYITLLVCDILLRLTEKIIIAFKKKLASR